MPAKTLALPILGLLTLALGCQGGALPPRMISQIDDAQVSEWQLRLLTMDYARSFAATVENASDKIASQTDDPEIRRAALLW